MLLPILFAIFGTAGIFIWLMIYLFVLHQEKGEKIVEWFSKIFSWTGKKVEKTATAKTIENKIKSFINSINTEVKDLLPYDLKIKWISPEMDRDSFIKNNRVVLLLNYHQNRDENLSRATLMYMNKAVIPEARPHIHTKLGYAIDLMMTKKALFSFIEARSCLNHFLNSILRPETEKDVDLKQFCRSIDIIDERGLFTRILLRELLELGMKRSGITESGDTVHETNEFAKMLVKLAEKERGVDIDPSFIKHYIRVAVILVARPENVDLGPRIFLNTIESFLKQSVNTFYIFARGDRNLEFAKEVVDACENKFVALSKIHEEEYQTKIDDGTILNGYCAIFYNRKAI